MLLKSIHLQNFRNHEEIVVDFDEKNTFLVGENGAGKTNIIEAIYSFAILRPFRSAKREVFVLDGKEYAKISLCTAESCHSEFISESQSSKEVFAIQDPGQQNDTIDEQKSCSDDRAKEENETKNLEIFWQTSPRKTVLKINEVKLTTREFLNKKDFFAVLFVPDDLNLPFSSPSVRRKQLGRSISPLSADYFEAELKMEKILRQRNSLLEEIRENRAEKSEIDFWNEKFIKTSELISQKRQEYIDFINSKIEKYFQEISKTKEKLRIDFLQSSENLKEDLEQNFQKELILGRTLKGAHRDDFVFYFCNNSIIEKASRGQIRSAILSFKLAERDFVQKEKEVKPLLLFDDVFSELDETHRNAFNELISSDQAVISATEIDSGFYTIKL